MKSFAIIAGASLFGALVNAAPVEKRDVVWVTEVDIAYVTVEATRTVLGSHPHTWSGTAISAPTTTDVAPTSTSTSIDIAPTTTSTSDDSDYVAPTTISTSSVASTTSAATTSEHIAPVATTSTTSAVAAITTTSASSGEGPAASGTSYTGDLTWYEVGLGSCGIESVSTDKIVAISYILMDNADYYTANPNDNPLCGRQVSITSSSGTAYTATVVDRCTGCAEGDLDLSEGLFTTVVGDPSIGRVSDMKWEWL